MRELLDITTKCAMGEEAVQANFSGKAKAIAHLNGGDKRARDRKCHEEEMMAAADHVTNPQPHRQGACPEHFKKALEAPCPF
jgi:hypothetical protein